jgi:hypothetical protein
MDSAGPDRDSTSIASPIAAAPIIADTVRQFFMASSPERL